jgi:thiol-disulfide isomerase/thioredoxin
MKPEAPVSSPSALVVCLCAQWCGVCGEYRARFVALQAKYPELRFLWIDVEDEADLLYPLDVENFPTLLLASRGEVRFFGAVTPQIDTLERLIRSQIQAPGATALTDQSLIDLVARIAAREDGP